MKRLLLVCLLTVTLHPALGAGFAVIVHPSNRVDRMPADEIRKIYLGEKNTWDGGGRILALRLGDENPVLRRFLSEILSMSTDVYLAHWRKKLFSPAGGIPPKRLERPEELVEMVRKTPDAIGMVPEAMTKERGIKRIEIEPR